MQTPFHACGFLYSLKHNKILLVQSKPDENAPASYSMLEGEGIEGEEAEVTFQRIINQLLNINIKPKDIYPIYDYFSNAINKTNFVFYADVKTTKSFDDLKKGSLSWLKFSETIKLPFSRQTKQDMIVGERVINAKLRDLLPPEASL